MSLNKPMLLWMLLHRRHQKCLYTHSLFFFAFFFCFSPSFLAFFLFFFFFSWSLLLSDSPAKQKCNVLDLSVTSVLSVSPIWRKTCNTKIHITCILLTVFAFSTTRFVYCLWMIHSCQTKRIPLFPSLVLFLQQSRIKYNTEHWRACTNALTDLWNLSKVVFTTQSHTAVSSIFTYYQQPPPAIHPQTSQQPPPPIHPQTNQQPPPPIHPQTNQQPPPPIHPQTSQQPPPAIHPQAIYSQSNQMGKFSSVKMFVC